jgi:hypothetical protein
MASRWCQPAKRTPDFGISEMKHAAPSMSRESSIRSPRIVTDSWVSAGSTAAAFDQAIRCSDDGSTCIAQRRVSLVELPFFRAPQAHETPRQTQSLQAVPSKNLHQKKKRVQTTDRQDKNQEREREQEMATFADRLMTSGIFVKQQHRWTRKAACMLTLSADNILSWAAVDRKSARNGSLAMAHVAAVFRDGKAVALIPSTSSRALWQGQSITLVLNDELEAVLLECVLKSTSARVPLQTKSSSSNNSSGNSTNTSSTSIGSVSGTAVSSSINSSSSISSSGSRSSISSSISSSGRHRLKW